MKIRESKEKRQALFDTIRQRGHYDEPREGMHLSDLLFCNYKTYYRKKGLTAPLSDEQVLLFMTGYAFQYFLFPKNDEKTYEKDGIICSPDVEDEYLWTSDCHPMGFKLPLAEVKSTRMNMNKFRVEDNPHYIEQCAGYCCVKEVLSCDLIVFFVMGNYAPPFPNAKIFEINFTEEELADYWKEFLRRKDVLEVALKNDTLPDPHFGYEWECQKNRCEVRDTLCPKYGGKQ